MNATSGGTGVMLVGSVPITRSEKMIRLFRRLKERINHILGWLPILWNDYHFDYCYIYNVLYYKLKMMDEDVNCFMSEKGKRKFKVALHQLERLIEDDYHTKAIKNYKRILWKPRFAVRVENLMGASDDDRKCHEKYEKTRRVLKYAIDHAEAMNQQDIDGVFDYLKKHIRTLWW
jgi:hypothetical protein